MIYLDVPYADKDEARALGARWNVTARRWYAPDEAARQRLSRWAAKPDLPMTLPGEDRTFDSGLFVDLVPLSCWFTNVRSCVAPTEWDRLRRMIYGRAEDRCEACGAAPDRSRGFYLEAHERWSYDEATFTQGLRRLIALCSACHETTHYGLAQVNGNAERALTHLKAVTWMTEQEAHRHLSSAIGLWQRRSAHDWRLDLSLLADADIELAPPPDVADRRGVARENLDRLDD